MKEQTPNEPNNPIISPLSEHILKKAREKDIPDWLFRSILRETKSTSAIILTFEDKIPSNLYPRASFHIASIGMDFKGVPMTLLTIIESLAGIHGGVVKTKESDVDLNQPPQETK